MKIEDMFATLPKDRTYSRRDLHQMFLEERGDMKESNFQWILYNLLKDGRLYRIGRDEYSTRKQEDLPVYTAPYTDKAKVLIRMISENFPDLTFTVLESTLLNEFLNHLIAHDTLYVQIGDNVSHHVFDSIRNEYPGLVLYKPSAKELDYYWNSGCLIILDMVSQSPLRPEAPHEMMLEKLLVDIVAEKSLKAAYSMNELPSIFESAMKAYKIDKPKMLRYASRRGKKTEIENLLQGGGHAFQDNVLK